MRPSPRRPSRSRHCARIDGRSEYLQHGFYGDRAGIAPRRRGPRIARPRPCPRDYSTTGAWSPNTAFFRLHASGAIGRVVTLATVVQFFALRPTRMWRHVIEAARWRPRCVRNRAAISGVGGVLSRARSGAFAYRAASSPLLAARDQVHSSCSPLPLYMRWCGGCEPGKASCRSSSPAAGAVPPAGVADRVVWCATPGTTSGTSTYSIFCSMCGCSAAWSWR